MKRVFNTKNIVIFCVIVVFLCVIIYLLFDKKNNEKVMLCSAELSKTEDSNITFDVEINYTTKIKEMMLIFDVEYLIDLSNEELEMLETFYESYFDNYINDNSIKVDVYREGNNIKTKFDVDYNKYKPGDISFPSFIEEEIEDKELTIEMLKNTIESMGGSCIEK